jgi:hypothetical protein
MIKQGVYYLARLSKIGNLTTEMVIQALLKPTPIVIYGNAWSFINTKEYAKNDIKYIAGRLVKYRPDAEVIVVDPTRQTEFVQQEPNLRLASSPFVYIPDYSGVAFLRVSNQIEEWNFTRHFATIIEATHHDFFVGCKLNLIADLKTFSMKLLSLSGIYRISAKVVPPNPAFGSLWKPLRDYIKKRRSGQMVIREDSKSKKYLETKIPEIVDAVARQPEGQPYIPKEELPIGDAAVLMAADGYGTGHIKGQRAGSVVVIRTSDTSRNFTFDKDPEMEELYFEALHIFQSIHNERHMEHD